MTSEPRPGQERMIADPKILAGKPVVRGTRIAVGLVLEELAQNPDIRELLAAHPDLTRADMQACLAYGYGSGRARRPSASGRSAATTTKAETQLCALVLIPSSQQLS